MFGIALIVVALAIAYFHYVQGFFSAALSMIAAVFSVCIAFGFMPQIAHYLVNAKLPDCSYGVALAGLFAFSYLLQRILVDGLVPGNIRVNLIADKVGAGVCGVVVGVITAGMLAVIAQSLPLAPSILTYSRADMDSDRHVTGWVKGRQEDLYIYDELRNPALSQGQSGMIVPFDDAVVGLASRASAGSLAGAVLWSDMFPDYLTETFANRLGVQVGAAHSAINSDKGSAVKVVGLYTPPGNTLAQVDEDFPAYHSDTPAPPFAPPPAPLKPQRDQVILIVRAVASNTLGAADGDGLLRFGMASVRLQINDKDYYPIGTLQGTRTLFYDRVDDPLFLDISKGAAGVDLVFLVDGSDVVKDKANAPASLPNGSCLVFKRFARIDLSGAAGQISDQIPDPDASHVAVMRKPWIMQQPAVAKALGQ